MKPTKCKGEGVGWCKRCREQGKYSYNWMCFLYEIEGIEGIYCRECAEKIIEERNKKP